MPTFEYTTEQYLNVQNPESMTIKLAAAWLKDDLIQKGLLGWEMVSLVNQMGGELLAVFKRPTIVEEIKVNGKKKAWEAGLKHLKAIGAANRAAAIANGEGPKPMFCRNDPTVVCPGCLETDCDPSDK